MCSHFKALIDGSAPGFIQKEREREKKKISLLFFGGFEDEHKNKRKKGKIKKRISEKQPQPLWDDESAIPDGLLRSDL